MKQVALMYVRIACARNHQAKQIKVLTYTRTCASKSRPPESNNTPMYFFHTFTGQHCLAKLKKPPSFSGKYRFVFGQLTREAATWYLSQLRWPKNDDTLGISWIEFALDFEIATGLILPRSATVCENSYGSKNLWRHALWRHAKWRHSKSKDKAEARLDHVLEKYIDKKRPRFRCMVCSRSGAWGDRSKFMRFMRFSCAGIKETPKQALSRHRLELAAQRCILDNPLPPPHLGEKAQVFSDIVGSISRHYHCYYGERILTCRALAALGLPKSAGLDRRPILLCQDLVTAELTQCAEALPKKNWNRIHILTPNNLHGARITLTIPLTYRDQVQRELHLVRLDRGYGSWHGVALPWWSVYKGSE